VLVLEDIATLFAFACSENDGMFRLADLPVGDNTDLFYQLLISAAQPRNDCGFSSGRYGLQCYNGGVCTNTESGK